MALMFPRLARNYAKDGYFPTDNDTLQRILTTLSPSSGEMRIIDPCAGEGVAIAECKHHLGAERTLAYAVEYHQERAYQAKQLVDRCIHGDFIVPHTVLDGEFRRWLAAGFDRVQVFLAPEQQFKQAVVLGIRQRHDASSARYRATLQTLEEFCQLTDKSVLPSVWPHDVTEPYRVPTSVGAECRFNALKLDPVQLAEEITQYPCLWGQWAMHLNQSHHSQRRPLMALSDWHLALVLAAGQVSGVVHSNDGARTYVVKGNTFKHKKESVTFEEIGDNKTREIRTSLDVFIPIIKALDFSPGSPTFGQVLTIK